MTQASNKAYDLEERTAKFGENVIDLCREIKQTPLTRRLIDQVVGSSGSMGANYMEANNASSKKDFRHKILIAKKESQETKHWLRLLARAVPEHKPTTRVLWQEAHELTLIFQKIISSVSKGGK